MKLKNSYGIHCYALFWVLILSTCSVAPQHPASPKPPNIVVIVADDMGYSDLGCFGSEISTPNIDALAASGQIFTQFHTASACSPTRAMLLTGVDHHLAGMGTMAEFLRNTTNQTGKPGYEGYLNDRVVSVASLLKQQGYHTYIAGKWHLGNTAQTSPTAQGFERSYVLMPGSANHFHPDPRRPFWADGQFARYPQGTFSTQLYTDKLIEFIQSGQSDRRPFFLYAAYSAPHWPLQAPLEFREKYRGKYDKGFEYLRAQRLAGLIRKGIVTTDTSLTLLPKYQAGFLDRATPFRQWNELDEMEQKMSARSMEVFAAMVDNLDFHIGRLVTYLKEIGEYENTLFVFMSDNGADAIEFNQSPPNVDPLENMGSPRSAVAYGAGWAHASSVNNRLYKAYCTQGGIHTPLIIRLPHQETGQGLLTEFTSVLDLFPTFLELAGIDYPANYQGKEVLPLQGQPLLSYLKGEQSTVHGDDFVMGWELFGRAALRKGDWKITFVDYPLGSGEFELFNLAKDPGETVNLAQSYPEKFAELKRAWEDYRRHNGVVRPVWKE